MPVFLSRTLHDQLTALFKGGVHSVFGFLCLKENFLTAPNVREAIAPSSNHVFSASLCQDMPSKPLWYK